MEILNFSYTPRQSFIDGFLTGLASPAMLFERFTSPILLEVHIIPLPLLSTGQALNNDWEKITMDFRNVVIKHGKSIETSKPSEAES